MYRRVAFKSQEVDAAAAIDLSSDNEDNQHPEADKEVKDNNTAGKKDKYQLGNAVIGLNTNTNAMLKDQVVDAFIHLLNHHNEKDGTLQLVSPYVSRTLHLWATKSIQDVMLRKKNNMFRQIDFKKRWAVPVCINHDHWYTAAVVPHSHSVDYYIYDSVSRSYNQEKKRCFIEKVHHTLYNTKRMTIHYYGPEKMITNGDKQARNDCLMWTCFILQHLHSHPLDVDLTLLVKCSKTLMKQQRGELARMFKDDTYEYFPARNIIHVLSDDNQKDGDDDDDDDNKQQDVPEDNTSSVKEEEQEHTPTQIKIKDLPDSDSSECSDEEEQEGKLDESQSLNQSPKKKLKQDSHESAQQLRASALLKMPPPDGGHAPHERQYTFVETLIGDYVADGNQFVMPTVTVITDKAMAASRAAAVEWDGGDFPPQFQGVRLDGLLQASAFPPAGYVDQGATKEPILGELVTLKRNILDPRIRNKRSEKEKEDDDNQVKCAMHGEIIWLNAHESLFVDKSQERRALWMQDLQVLRESRCVILLPLLYESFFKKWIDLGEQCIVDAWKKAGWYTSRISRAEANKDNLLGGGTPCDNGRIENENRWFKEGVHQLCVGYQDAFKFMDVLASRIHLKSLSELSFGGRFSQAVQNYEFNVRVFKLTGELGQEPVEHVSVSSSDSSCVSDSNGAEELYSRCNDVTPLDLRFNVTSAKDSEFQVDEDYKDVEGRQLMATWKAIKLALAEGHPVGTPGKSIERDDKPSILNFLNRGTKKAGQWRKKYEMLMKCPELAMSMFETMSTRERCCEHVFDEVADVLELFNVVEPITDVDIITALRQRLVQQKHCVESVAKIMARGRNGLLKCSCPNWLKYAWCEHACADARCKKIILSFNKGMDPNQSKKRGAKKRKHGVALPRGRYQQHRKRPRMSDKNKGKKKEKEKEKEGKEKNKSNKRKRARGN